MIPEIGHISLIAAFVIAIVMFIVPLVGTYTGSISLMRLTPLCAVWHFVGVTVAMACLAWSFWVDDFSVIYVAKNSNLELPPHYKISALWSAHEGSLLLWVWLLAGWILSVTLTDSKRDLSGRVRPVAILGGVSAGFISFLAFTSNPFLRYLPFSPRDGSDLNPLLQDIGLIMHPPTLYLGYVGLAVPFAYAVAALLDGHFDSIAARRMRPWALAAWVFLTIGIALGSWWAYYELGWGGWWFWDPVENASFMPWLVATALLHALATTTKRDLNKHWCLFLAIMGFSLSLLGTFLVRSGVLTSVHAFASDPSRGYFILAYLFIVIGGALLLFAIRGPSIASARENNITSNSWLSREILLLSNNVLLVIAMAIILLGTLYPLIADALKLGKISVGPPYFNFFFVPLMMLVVAIMPIGSLVKWSRNGSLPERSYFFIIIAVSLASSIAFSFLYGGDINLTIVATVTVLLWAAIIIIHDAIKQSSWYPSYLGMLVAHIGVLICATGVALTVTYSKESDVRISPGKAVVVSGYEFYLEDLSVIKGPNYVATVGKVNVYKNSEPYLTLFPEKRSYNSDKGNKMTEAAIDPGLFRDIYVAMGEPIDPDKGEKSDWAMRIHYKPFVRWIWLGAIVMSVGGLLCLLNRKKA